MARQRDPRTGQYAPAGQMGAEDFVPELAMERFLNTTRVSLLFGPDSQDAVFAVIPTGLQAEQIGDTSAWQGFKWVLFGATAKPDGIVSMRAFASLVTASQGLRFQLLHGRREDVVEGTSDLLIAESLWARHLNTSGASPVKLPLAFDVLAPMPILDNEITVTMQGCANGAELAAEKWVVTLLWGWSTLQPGDSNAIWQQMMLARATV